MEIVFFSRFPTVLNAFNYLWVYFSSIYLVKVVSFFRGSPKYLNDVVDAIDDIFDNLDNIL